MDGIRNHIDEELIFAQPAAMRQRFELRAGDSVISVLTLRGLLGLAAVTEGDDGTWMFQRSGLFRPFVSVRPQGEETAIARYDENFWGHSGTLQMLNGRRLRFTASFWLMSFAITTEEGVPLVSYRRIRGLFRRSASVRIHPDAATMEELPWLAPLGWYLAVLSIRDRSARAG